MGGIPGDSGLLRSFCAEFSGCRLSDNSGLDSNHGRPWSTNLCGTPLEITGLEQAPQKWRLNFGQTEVLKVDPPDLCTADRPGNPMLVVTPGDEPMEANVVITGGD